MEETKVNVQELLMIEFLSSANKLLSGLVKSLTEQLHTLFEEDQTVKDSELFQATLAGFRNLSVADRNALRFFVDQLLEWRKKKKPEDSDNVKLLRDYLFFTVLLVLPLKDLDAREKQVASLFAACWDFFESSHEAEANEGGSGGDAAVGGTAQANRQLVSSLCTKVLAAIYPHRFNSTPDQLDDLFHLKKDGKGGSKKKVEKAHEQVLVQYLCPLVENELDYEQDQNFLGFRETLGTTFAPIVGSWNDKKKEKSGFRSVIKTVMRCVQHSQDIGSRWGAWLSD
ncbi:hypothetical protein QOT17_023281, partial [Balamuthia mandrillaris]